MSVVCRVAQNLTLLLNKIREIVRQQTECEVLETCGRTLEYLCSEQCAVYSRCKVARATITDMCVDKYREAIDDFRTLIEGVRTVLLRAPLCSAVQHRCVTCACACAQGETPDADEQFSVTNSLRKVSIMYMCHNLNDNNIWDSLFEDLPKCLEKDDPMPKLALVYVVRACFYSLLWALHELEERGTGADLLRDRLHGYCALCRDIVARGTTAQLRSEVSGPRPTPRPAPRHAPLHAPPCAGLHQHLRPADPVRGAAALAAPPRRGALPPAGVRARRRALRPAQRLHTGVRLRAAQLRYSHWHT